MGRAELSSARLPFCLWLMPLNMSLRLNTRGVEVQSEPLPNQGRRIQNIYRTSELAADSIVRELVDTRL